VFEEDITAQGFEQGCSPASYTNPFPSVHRTFFSSLPTSADLRPILPFFWKTWSSSRAQLIVLIGDHFLSLSFPKPEKERSFFESPTKTRSPLTHTKSNLEK
jgi:hypothetical protein